MAAEDCAVETPEEVVYAFPRCTAWDVSALLSMNIRSDVQPGGDTWDEFVTSVQNLVLAVMREARRMARLVPYRTIPHPNPADLMTYVIAMKTQYVLQGDVCSVRVGLTGEDAAAGRLGVFATDRLALGNVVTTLPVDALVVQHHGGVILTPDNASIDPSNYVLTSTRHEGVLLASSRLYVCPERCGHLIRAGGAAPPNATILDLFGGVFHAVQITRDVEVGEELVL